MPATDPSLRNLDALLLGTGEFSFSPDATSAADARAKGYQDFGNIVATGLKPETDKVEHEGSYRGKRRVDKTFVTKVAMEYSLKLDEFDRQKLQLALGGTDAGTFTQSAQTAVTVPAALAFATTAGVAGRWYDVLVSGARIRELTALLCIPAASVSVTLDGTANTVTLATHGMEDGRPVILGGTLPAELTAGTVYYVRDSATNTFKLAATPGGSLIDFTGNGTSVTIGKGLVENTDYVVDAKLGRVRFTAARTTNITLVVSAPAIVTGDAANLLGQTPLQSMIKSGYGRLAIFDDTHANKLVYLHEDFSCQVYLDSLDDTDGKKVAEMTLKVRVTDQVGTVWTAE